MHAKQNVKLTRLTARFSLQILQHFLEKQKEVDAASNTLTGSVPLTPSIKILV